MITTEMMRNPRVIMVERDQIQRLIGEQKLALSGMIDPAAVIQVGKLLGAQYMLFGSYTDAFSNLRIDVRVVEVQTGRLRRSFEVTDKREHLFRSVNRLTNQLFKDLDLEPASPLPVTPAVPARAALLFSQGLGFEDQGDKQKAREMYQKALEVFPQYEDANKRLSRLGGAK
jgi:TolB-like protein